MRVNPFLILGLFLVYSRGELAEPEPCTNLRIAKEYNMVQYCIDNDWTKRTPSVDQSESTCQICMEMVKEAREQLMSNETRGELKQVLEGVCQFLVLKPIVKECDKLADQLGDELVAVLSSRMDPETVCALAQLCWNNDTVQPVQAERGCSPCEDFMYGARNMLNVIPKKNLENYVLSICRNLSSYSDACYYYATSNMEDIYNEVRHSLEKKPCDAIRVCRGRPVPLIGREKPRKSSLKSFCRYCNPVMDILKKGYNAIDLESPKSLCSLMPGYESVCRDFLDANGEKMVAGFFESRQFCSNLCSPGLESVPVWPLLPAHSERKPAGLESVLPLWTGVGRQVVPGHVDAPIVSPFILGSQPVRSEECTSCHQMFTVMTNHISSDPNYLKDVLAILCKEGSHFDNCQKFVEDQFTHLRDAIVNFTDPKKICPELVYPCQPVEVSVEDSSLEGSCNFCTKTFQHLISAFQVSDSVGQLKERLVETCLDLPVDSREDCTRFMGNVVEGTVNSLGTKYQENDTCDFLRLCKEPGTTTPVKTEEVKDGKCQICMMIIETLYQELQDEKNEDAIRKGLENICTLLPHRARDSCKGLVDQYTDEIVKMIIDSETPSQVCRSLALCTRRQISEMVEPQVSLIPEDPKNGVCEVCKFVIKFVEFVGANQTDEIRKCINESCELLPFMSDVCEHFIEKYVDLIITLIENKVPPEAACTFLKLCKASHAEPSNGVNFDVETNEVKDVVERNPRENCNFCRLLESSMRIEGEKKRAAEGMLALLAETCLLNPENENSKCHKKMSEEVLAHGVDSLFNMSNICDEFGICPEERKPNEEIAYKMLNRVHSAVQECAMCEALVGIVTSHEKMLSKSYDFYGNASRICSTMPRNKRSDCKAMITSYGPSIVNLYVDQKVDRDHICVELKLCDESLQTKVDMPVSDIEQGGAGSQRECLKGPAFWCANVENAKKCGTFVHCREVVWANGEPPQ